MALTASDETDLLLPLHSGLHEQPRFATFLERLRRRTGADHVSLTLRQGDMPIHEATELFAGRNLRAQAAELGLRDFYLMDRFPYERLRPGRVYAVSDFVDHDPAYKAFRENHIRRLGIADERVVRVIEADGVSAWLAMARAGPCSAADGALLSALAPYVAAALRSLVLIEQQHMQAAMGEEGLARAGLGWLLFDRQARLIACDASAMAQLAAAGAGTVAGERLRGLDPAAERAIAAAAQGFADDPAAPPRALVLADDPRCELLLVASRGMPAAAPTLPAMLALCRFDVVRSGNRAALLARLHALPLREADLAVRLADGLSIAEGAAAMGLTLETARNYSKRLYAKLGVRGQAELVRLVCESCAVLA